MARSVFYYHLNRLKAADRYANEKESIKLIFHEHKGRYGYRRVTAEMHNRGFMLNHKTIQKLMGDLGLKSKIRQVRYRSYKGEVGKIAPNIIDRDFTAEAPWGEELEIEQCVHEADNTVSEVSQQSFLTVSYEGAARNLILAPDNFFRNFPVLMPGDEWEDTFTLVNTTASRAEFFLRTELPEELSETEKELLSKVKLEIREGDSVIYEGDLESEGLWAAKSLGICSPDERKEICFSIRVPSELGDEWALRKSGVKWIFSVEGEDLPQEEGPSIWHSAPKTGLRDPSAAVPIGIAVTGAFLFLTAGRSERRKE